MNCLDRHVWLTVILLMIGASGCKPRHADSAVKGHFEDSTKKDLETIAGKVRQIPEYQPSQAILLSPKLLAADGLDISNTKKLVSAIISSGAEIWLTSNKFEPADNFLAQLDLQGDNKSKIRKIETTIESSPGDLGFWARDYSPHGVSIDGKLGFLDYNYFSWGRQHNDANPRQLAKSMNLARYSIPLYFEGGNFMVNDDGACFMSERVIEANTAKAVEGDRVYTRADIERIFRVYSGCKTVEIFPQLPKEGTGHIDIWMKFLSNDTLIVADILASTVKATTREYGLQETAQLMRDFLDKQAVRLSKSFKVIRLPVGRPVLGEMGFVSLPSYTNSLLVNGTAIIPQYKESGAFSDYDNKAVEIYRSAGFKTVLIDARILTRNGGAIHCATMQVPKI